jgi:hypothetical protein
LKKDGEVIATMSSPKMFGTSVTATMDGVTYTMRKGRLRKPGAVMRKLGEEEDLALLEIDAVGKGKITLGGARYLWEREGAADRWTLSNEGGDGVFVTTRDARGKHPVGNVDVDIPDPNLNPLLLLTWFLASTSEC